MTIKEIKERLAAIRQEAEQAGRNGDNERLDKLIKEATELSDKLDAADKLKKLNRIADDASGGDPEEGERGEDPKNAATERGKSLLNGKAVKMSFKKLYKAAVSSATTVLPKHTASDLNDAFNSVSSLIDAVKIVPLPGGESYQRGFVKSYGEGDYTAEGAAATTAEPTFDYADITKAKVTAYAEEPSEIQKLAPAVYDETISDSVVRAVRRKLSREIVIGAGTTNTLRGIFNAQTKVISGDNDVEISAITATTLDEIIFAYGGDEDVEGACGLVLNKKDLKAFATLRNSDGKRTYDVKYNGNTGTIDGVPYIIDSACPALTASATTANTFCMAYGPYSNYELAFFSDLDVRRSTEYKFKEGQVAHRAEIFAGGNVTKYQGFVRVKKVAAN